MLSDHTENQTIEHIACEIVFALPKITIAIQMFVVSTDVQDKTWYGSQLPPGHIKCPSQVLEPDSVLLYDVNGHFN